MGSYYPGQRPGGAGMPGGRWMRQSYARLSALDSMVNGFRERWETNAAFRARMSAVVGAAALVGLCVVMAIAATVANAAFGVGGGSHDPLAYSGNGSGLQGSESFPTETIPPWTPGSIPNAAPAPASQTPPPGPTKVPTPTQSIYVNTTPSAGNLPTTCNGNSGNNTWAFTPCPLVAGQSGTFTVTVPKYPNTPINVIISFGVCANGANCTLLFTPQQNSLNGSGVFSVSFTVPAAAANNTAPVSGMVQVQNGGPSFSYTAAPVQ
jgi:hypothetical protein